MTTTTTTEISTKHNKNAQQHDNNPIRWGSLLANLGIPFIQSSVLRIPKASWIRCISYQPIAVVKSWKNSSNNNCNRNNNNKTSNWTNPHGWHKGTNRARASQTTPTRPLTQASTYPSKLTTLILINNSYYTNKNYNHS